MVTLIPPTPGQDVFPIGLLLDKIQLEMFPVEDPKWWRSGPSMAEEAAGPQMVMGRITFGGKPVLAHQQWIADPCLTEKNMLSGLDRYVMHHSQSYQL